MAAPLASVDQLAARLGVTLAVGSPDRARAEANLTDVSARARSVANQTWSDPTQVPDEVQAVVLAATYRLFKNPQRMVQNAGNGFSVGLSTDDFKGGDVFLQGERSVLRRFRPKGSISTMSFTRGDPVCSYGSFSLTTLPDGTVSAEPFFDGQFGEG